METYSALCWVTLLAQVFMLASPTVIKMTLHGVYDPLHFSLFLFHLLQLHNNTNICDSMDIGLSFSSTCLSKEPNKCLKPFKHRSGKHVMHHRQCSPHLTYNCSPHPLWVNQCNVGFASLSHLQACLNAF